MAAIEWKGVVHEQCEGSQRLLKTPGGQFDHVLVKGRDSVDVYCCRFERLIISLPDP